MLMFMFGGPSAFAESGKLSESYKRPVILTSEFSLHQIQYLKSNKKVRDMIVPVIDAKSEFGSLLISRFVINNSYLSVDLFDNPSVIISDHSISSPALAPYLNDELDELVESEELDLAGDLDEGLAEKHSFTSSNDLLEFLTSQAVEELKSDKNIYLVLSIETYDRLSLGAFSRYYDKTWRSSLNFFKRYKATIAVGATTALLVAGFAGYKLHLDQLRQERERQQREREEREFQERQRQENIELVNRGWDRSRFEQSDIDRSNRGESINWTLSELAPHESDELGPYLELNRQLPVLDGSTMCGLCFADPATCRFIEDENVQMPFCRDCQTSGGMRDFVLNGGSEPGNPSYPTRFLSNSPERITASDLQNLGASDEEIQRYRRNIVRNATDNWGECPECGHVSRSGIKQSGRVFDCQVCEKAYCRQCGQQPHADGFCTRFENPYEAIERDLRASEDPQRIPTYSNNFSDAADAIRRDRNHPFNHDDRPCPGCGYMQNRVSDCNHVSCPNCRIEWNWVFGRDRNAPRGSSRLYAVGPKSYQLSPDLKAWRQGMDNPNNTPEKRAANRRDSQNDNNPYR